MNSKLLLKQNLLVHIKTDLSQKRGHLLEAINSAKQARDSESKSSAGDKYETGRAMMQIDIDNYQGQLNLLDQKLNELGNIPLKPSSKVIYGSLVTTSLGQYFIALGVGIVELNQEKYFCVSGGSPIARAMDGKKPNTEFEFLGKKVKILAID